jgi:hypothetical protein
MLASYDTSPGGNTTLTQAQLNAGAYAKNMFCDQTVLGQFLTNATLQTSPGTLNAVSKPTQCNVLVALGNPDSNYTAVSVGDPLGRTVMVFCAYGYQPAFLSLMPFAIKVVPMTASSFGGLPQVDAVVVFDYSGSMDDFTSVLFVRREWYWPPNSTAIGQPLYSVVTGNASKSITDNKLVDYINWQWDVSTSAHAGTATNVLPPQTLEGVGSSTAFGGAIGNPLYYNSTLRANPIFCTSYLGSLSGPPKPAGSAAATFPAYATWKSPGGTALNLSSNDYGQPPGNFKPVFVSGDGMTSLTPLAWATQYQNSNTGSKINPPAPWAASVQNWGYPPFGGKYSDYAVPTANTVATDLQNDNINFTDLVVDIVDPTGGVGGTYSNQPIPAVGAAVYSSLASTGMVFSGFQMTFPSDEPDNRLAGKQFNFANLATVVEAARGNLDNSANYHGACVDGPILIRNGPFAATVVSPSTTTTVTIAAPTGNANFQLAYERIAMMESQPYATAVDGAVNGFFYKLSTLCDARFGLVGFSGVSAGGADFYGLSQTGGPTAYTPSSANFNSQGQSPSDSCYHSELEQYLNNSFSSIVGNCNFCWWRSNQTNGSYPAAAAKGPLSPVNSEQVDGFTGKVSGQTGFKLPRTPLSDANMQLDLVTSSISAPSPYNLAPFGDIWSGTSSNTAADGVWNGRPLTDTMCDEALQTAYNNFKTNSSYKATNRRAARKAIVFFTDGEPTGGIGSSGTGSGSSVASNSFAVANLCSNNSISLYTIGLNASLNSTITNDQYQFLGDGLETSHSPDNGIASVAGNGSRFFACQTGADVRAAFASIARRLSQAQQ